MQSLTKTKVAYSEVDGIGKTKTFITSETAWNKIIKEVTDANTEAAKTGGELQTPPTLVASQTFAYKFATTVDEAVQLAGGSGVGEYENIDVFLGVFNYGASLRQADEANDLLTSDNFVASEQPVDVSYAVAQKSERAKMTPEEKAAKNLGISPDKLREALALLTQQQAASV